MQKNLIEWFLIFSLLHVLEGSRMLRKFNEFVLLERTVKIILESCYDNDSPLNLILIKGDFDGSIENSSIIQINDFRKVEFWETEQRRRFDLKSSKIVLIQDSPVELKSDLQFLSQSSSDFWDHMTSFFIIAKYKEGCELSNIFANLFWSKRRLNSIYICLESSNTPVLYTLNSMANYAPHPWKRMEELEYLNAFRQVFDESISCKNLNFDKTRRLDEYEIEIVGNVEGKYCFTSGSYNCMYHNPYSAELKPLRYILIALNTGISFEDEMNNGAVEERWANNKLDMTRTLYALSSIPQWRCFFLPYVRTKLIAIVKLEPEVTTLYKIFKLWSIPVLIAAAIALVFLLFIVIIKNHNFGLGMLDVVRLLTYTSIRTNDRTHAFRIYFTTMLIFMVISNGVFQGKIAAFLTTRERASAIGNINELADLGYTMFAVNNYELFLNEKCPKCNFKPASSQECIEQVLNHPRNLCAMREDEYHVDYLESELDHIPEVLLADFAVYGCRKHWALVNRFSDMFSRLFETGILHHWKREGIDVAKRQRIAREAEWSSAQYRPVELYKLKFAFQVLALGLLISTIVLIWELYQAKYGTTRKSSIVQPTRRNRTNSTTKKMLLSLRYRRSIILNGYFSKYPLTIKQDYMSRIGGISQSIDGDIY